jgi:hypothetical protein
LGHAYLVDDAEVKGLDTGDEADAVRDERLGHRALELARQVEPN